MKVNLILHYAKHKVKKDRPSISPSTAEHYYPFKENLTILSGRLQLMHATKVLTSTTITASTYEQQHEIIKWQVKCNGRSKSKFY